MAEQVGVFAAYLILTKAFQPLFSVSRDGRIVGEGNGRGSDQAAEEHLKEVGEESELVHLVRENLRQHQLGSLLGLSP